jgi:hypothetical protein
MVGAMALWQQPMGDSLEEPSFRPYRDLRRRRRSWDRGANRTGHACDRRQDLQRRLTHAVIGGVQKCLRRGEFCAHRYDRQYRRYGFRCIRYYANVGRYRLT